MKKLDEFLQNNDISNQDNIDALLELSDYTRKLTDSNDF